MTQKWLLWKGGRAKSGAVCRKSPLISNNAKKTAPPRVRLHKVFLQISNGPTRFWLKTSKVRCPNSSHKHSTYFENRCFQDEGGILHWPGNVFRNRPLDVDGRPLPQASINGPQIGNTLHSACSNVRKDNRGGRSLQIWTLKSYEIKPSEEFRQHQSCHNCL